MKYQQFVKFSILLSIACLMLLGRISNVSAQATSVKPGINESYENPDVEKRVKQFEGEGREIARHRDEIIKFCRLKPGMDVADVGAGTGLFTRPFAKQVGPEGVVYAVDISDEFIAHIESTCTEADIENVVEVLCTPKSTKLEAESVDLVFISDTYHHFEFPYKTLASIRQALRPGGKIVMVEFKKEESSRDWTKEHVRMTKQEAIEEITEAGFRLLKEEDEMMEDQYLLRFRKVGK